MKTARIILVAAAVLVVPGAMAQTETDAPMTFFVTGETHSGNLGGLAGADATCQRLATAAGAGNHTWRAFPPGASRSQNLPCNNWTHDGSDSIAMIGHHDRLSGTSTLWNSSHSTNGCSLEAFNQTGGAGRFYCFAAG